MILDRTQAPRFQQIDTIEFLPVSSTKLENGIEINSINGGSEEILKVDFIFDAGTWFQDKPLIANATNKLIKEGTTNYSPKEISEGIDNYGGFFQLECTFDKATLTLYTLSKYLDDILPIIKDVILNPTFEKEEFDIYKNNAFERFKINMEKVSFIARKEFLPLIFGSEHPYGFNANNADHENLSLKDIKEFFRNNYSLSCCKVLISGKVEENIITIIKDFFGNEPILSESNSNKEVAPIQGELSEIRINKENAIQSAIRIGRTFPNKLHPDYGGLQVLSTILGGYFGSRLMRNIREDKGYTYGIGCGLVSNIHGGYFFISTEVNGDVTKDALSEIYKEIETLTRNHVPQEELDLVKNYMLGQLLKSCDGPFNMASMFENVYNYGLDYSFYNHYINTIREMDSNTLLELANQYFLKTDLKEVVVGNLSKI